MHIHACANAHTNTFTFLESFTINEFKDQLLVHVCQSVTDYVLLNYLFSLDHCVIDCRERGQKTSCLLRGVWHKATSNPKAEPSNHCCRGLNRATISHFKEHNRFEVKHVLPLSAIPTRGLYHRCFNTFWGVWHSSMKGQICQKLSNPSTVACKVCHKLIGCCR